MESSLETTLQWGPFKGGQGTSKSLGTECTEQRVDTSDGERKDMLSAEFGNKENGLSKRGHWLPWQEKFMRSRRANGSPCSEECVQVAVPVARRASKQGCEPRGGGEGRDKEGTSRNASRAVPGVLFGFSPKDERYF